MKKALRTVFGFIVALISFAVISQILIAISPVAKGIVGIVVGLVNAAPDPQSAKTLQAFGNIFVVIVSLYPSVKIYKKITYKKQSLNNAESTIEEDV